MAGRGWQADIKVSELSCGDVPISADATSRICMWSLRLDRIREGGTFLRLTESRQRGGLDVGVLFLMALSMLVVTSISSALGTYGPQPRQQVLGGYFVGIFIADIVYRRRERSKRQ